MTLRLAVAVAVLISACGSSTPPPPASSTAGPTASSLPTSSGSEPAATIPASSAVSACDMVYKDEVASALGIDIGAAQLASSSSVGSEWESECDYWRHSYDGEIVPMQLTVAGGQAHFGAFESLKLEPGVEPLAGVGDDAILRVSTLWGLPGPTASLYAREGGTLIGLALGVADVGGDGSLVLVGDEALQRQALIALAGIVVDRLAGGPPSPAPAARVCALISLAEAQTLVGLPLGSATDVDNHDAWGPGCSYEMADGSSVEFFVGVNRTPGAREHFDQCATNSEAVLAFGEQAFYSFQCAVQVGFTYLGITLLARSGDTILSVGEGSRLEYQAGRDMVKEGARLALQRLGLAPGATPAPASADALAHPCTLASLAEVTAAVGREVTNPIERPAVDGENGMCFYRTADSFEPLRLRLGTGANAAGNFDHLRATAGYTAVSGVGDEAYQTMLQANFDEPLMTLYVRQGETVLELSLGGVSISPGNGGLVAPGTPEEQLQLLRELASLILPRIFGGH